MQVESEVGKGLLPLVVVENTRDNVPALLGRNWLQELKLDWKSVFEVSAAHGTLRSLKGMFPSVFSRDKGSISGFTASLVFKDNVQPVFCKHRNVPFAFREAVEKEIRQMVEQKILTPVKTSDWTTPVVVVPKLGGKIRICGDYSVSVNPNLRTEHYPLPRIDEVFATFSGCEVFTILDLRSAYLQLRLDAHARKVLTVNTHLGLRI